ncbi:hypothetical protein [Photobacterium lipolyticum]|uniref:Uncharacterized protein n=1 Tax=Photobacterium lipolyticum TaxID=266810 RepID=A0A2T3N339_9GAMM|nr:hypothetical protein [Photobacterium lipolyticum]PSW06796.1 hypothetical protein C9I89_04540 [Photobacterium lipolyticum]
MKLKRTLRTLLISILSIIAFAAPSLGNEQLSQQEMLDMLDQLDQLDRMDFLDALDRANDCISSRNYRCAERHLAEAAKYANGKTDKAEILIAKRDLGNERDLEAKEIAMAKQRKREAERRERERRREEERLRRLAWEEEDAADDTLIMSTFMQGLNQGLADMAERNAQRNLEINTAIRQANTLREQQERDYIEAQRKAQEKEAEWQRKQQQQLAQQRDQAEQQRRAEADRRRQLELARQREAEKLARQREKERQKQEKDRQRQAEKLAKEQAERAYLSKLLSGTRLGAMKCYGEIHVGGQLPKIKPKAVECVDVHYRVSCPTTARSTTGVLDYFTSFDMGCFGDTDKLSSDLGCKAEELRVTAQKVTKCN